MGNLDIHQCSSVLKQSTSIENVDQKKSKKNYWQFWKLLFTAKWRWIQLSSLFSGAANVWILLCRDEFRLLKFEPEGNYFLIRAAHKSFEGIMKLQWIIKVWQSWWGNFWDEHHIMIHCIFRLFTLYHNIVILITSEDGFTLSCSNSPDSAKDRWSGADSFHPETKNISVKRFLKCSSHHINDLLECDPKGQHKRWRLVEHRTVLPGIRWKWKISKQYERFNVWQY